MHRLEHKRPAPDATLPRPPAGPLQLSTLAGLMALALAQAAAAQPTLSDVTVHSTLGEGTVFTVDLPLPSGTTVRDYADAASPVEAARQFKRSIAQLWG